MFLIASGINLFPFNLKVSQFSQDLQKWSRATEMLVFWATVNPWVPFIPKCLRYHSSVDYINWRLTIYYQTHELYIHPHITQNLWFWEAQQDWEDETGARIWAPQDLPRKEILPKAVVQSMKSGGTHLSHILQGQTGVRASDVNIKSKGEMMRGIMPKARCHLGTRLEGRGEEQSWQCLRVYIKGKEHWLTSFCLVFLL